MKFRVLVTDDIDPDGVDILMADPRLQVDVLPTMTPEALLECIGGYDAVVGRSATRMPAEVLAHASRLRVLGRAGVGVDNIAMSAATERGIAVINAPAGNTVAVAELVLGSLVALLRQIPRANLTMHEGEWTRSTLMGGELRGRTMGIVGLGRIGSEVAKRAHAFGMPLVGFDPYVPDERFSGLRVQRCSSLHELLQSSDVVTVHTPITSETLGMIAERELSLLPPGAVVCNLARGGIVDEAALLAALGAARLRGAVLDVFSAEPLAPDHPFRSMDNVLLTPHIGASTMEAQRNVAVDVCAAVRDALLEGELSRSLNLAELSGLSWAEARSALVVAGRAAVLARSMLASRGVTEVRRLTVRCGPELAGAASLLLSAAAAGMLQHVLGSERVNLINARPVAEQRGVATVAGVADGLGGGRAVEVTIGGDGADFTVAGTGPADAAPRLTRIGDFQVDVPPHGTLLVLTNHDVPGVIGRVGTLLGDAGVNIAEYHQARLAEGGQALAAVAVDTPLTAELRAALLDLPDVHSATVVTFPE